jgi:hypothetical protein
VIDNVRTAVSRGPSSRKSSIPLFAEFVLLELDVSNASEVRGQLNSLLFEDHNPLAV